MADIEPRAIVEMDGVHYVVAYPTCSLAKVQPMPAARMAAAIAKHDYEALVEPIRVDGEQALRAYLEGYIDRGAGGRRQ